MKRILSVIALALVLSLCSGLMTSVIAETAQAYTRDENGYPDLQGEVFDIWYINRRSQYSDDLGNMEVIKTIEKLFNCDINFIHPPVGQEADHMAITMASDKLPDMFFCGAFDSYYPGGVSMAYEDGILYDYTDLINEQNTPNFCKLFLGDEFLAPLAKDDSGRIIRLGAKIMGSEEVDMHHRGPVVREDFLAEAGLEMPVTIADWYEMLTAFKELGVEYPLQWNSSVNMEYWAFAYGVIYNDFYVGEDGEVHYGPYEDAYGEFLTEMAKWYAEGLINPDFMNLSMWDAPAIVMNDKVGSYANHLMVWGGFDDYIAQNPEKTIAPAQYPKMNEEDELTNLRATTRNIGDFKYITADAENPLACVYLLDALYNPEISVMMEKGIEGVAWDYNENGIPVTKALPADGSMNLYAEITEWHMYEDNTLAGIEKKYPGKAYDAALLWAETTSDGRIPANFLMYTAEEAEVRASKLTDLTTYVDEMRLKFITGQVSMDEFDAYQEQMKAMGVEDLITVVGDAYARLQERR